MLDCWFLMNKDWCYIRKFTQSVLERYCSQQLCETYSWWVRFVYFLNPEDASDPLKGRLLDTPSTGSSCLRRLRTISMAVACASSKGDPKMSQNVNLPNLKISSKRRVWWCLGVSKKFLTNDKHHKSQCFLGQQITCLIGFSWRHGLVFVTFQPWKER